MIKISYISNPILKLIFRSFLLVITLVITGCSGTTNSVIAATGTTIGVEISQNQTTQTPIAILGYKRAEFAYVPTNKHTLNVTKKTESTESNGKKTTTLEGNDVFQSQQITNGAADSANVLMELKYFGIFSTGSDSGIYQRLAVGNIAVANKGAEFLFSRDSAGKIDPKIARYITQAKDQISIEELQLKKIIPYVTDGSDAVNKNTLAALVSAAKKLEDTQQFFPDEVVNQITKQTTGVKLNAVLFDFFDDTIEPLYKSLPDDKK
ncbi:MAG: hypothetical protein GQ583_05095 [Methyloprofundus sp.]|nr:hypothetical protein [Methyloprofundus sp.]